MTKESESQDTNVIPFPNAIAPEDDGATLVVNMEKLKIQCLIRMRDVEEEAEKGTRNMSDAAHVIAFWRQWLQIMDCDPDVALNEAWLGQAYVQDCMEVQYDEE